MARRERGDKQRGSSQAHIAQRVRRQSCSPLPCRHEGSVARSATVRLNTVGAPTAIAAPASRKASSLLESYGRNPLTRGYATFCQGCARSQPAAAPSSTASPKYRPMSWIDSGIPAEDRPAGRLIAGWPVTLNGVRAWRG